MAISPGGRPADDSPLGAGNNWVTRAGGLPKYIRMVAHALLKSGHSESQAIQLAVAAVKRWAAGADNVRPQVQAAAAKAVAEWEALKSHAHAAERGEALELAGAFNPALHPRQGGKFTPTGGTVAPTGGATETQLPPALQTSLASWQAANGLAVTGQYDTATQRSLIAAMTGHGRKGGKGAKGKAAKVPSTRLSKRQLLGHAPQAKVGKVAKTKAPAAAKTPKPTAAATARLANLQSTAARKSTVHLAQEAAVSRARTRGRATRPMPRERAVNLATAVGTSSDGPTITGTPSQLLTVVDLARAAPRLPKLAAKLMGHAKRHRTIAKQRVRAGDLQGAKRSIAHAKRIEALAKGHTPGAPKGGPD